MSKTDEYNDKLNRARKLYQKGDTYRHYKGGVYQVVGHVIFKGDKSVHVRVSRIDGPEFIPWTESDIEFTVPIGAMSETFIDEADSEKLKYVRVRKRQYTQWDDAE